MWENMFLHYKTENFQIYVNTCNKLKTNLNLLSNFKFDSQSESQETQLMSQILKNFYAFSSVILAEFGD